MSTISRQTSETICLLIHSVKNAIAYNEALKKAGGISVDTKQHLIIPIENRLTWCLRSLESRVSPENRKMFEVYIKKADSMVYDNVIQLLNRLKPEAHEVVENLLQALVSGEKITIEKTKPTITV